MAKKSSLQISRLTISIIAVLLIGTCFLVINQYSKPYRSTEQSFASYSPETQLAAINDGGVPQESTEEEFHEVLTSIYKNYHGFRTRQEIAMQ